MDWQLALGAIQTLAAVVAALGAWRQGSRK